MNRGNKSGGRGVVKEVRNLQEESVEMVVSHLVVARIQIETVSQTKMVAELHVEDIRAAILDPNSDRYARRRLYEFFKFDRALAATPDKSLMADCFFYDLHITYYVRDFPEPQPAHPGIFADFFPQILGRLIEPGNTLTLFVKGFPRDHFDEFRVIENLLVSRHLKYLLLGDPTVPIDPRLPINVGHLVFEWPIDSLDYIVEAWFESPAIEIEGYVSSHSVLSGIAGLYFGGDPEQKIRIRQLLKLIQFGFRLWRDNNGVFLLSDKLDSKMLKECLNLSELNRRIEDTARSYDAKP